MKSSSAKCLVLDRESFDLLLGPLKAQKRARKRACKAAIRPGARGPRGPFCSRTSSMPFARVGSGRSTPRFRTRRRTAAWLRTCFRATGPQVFLLLLRVPGTESTAHSTERAEAHRLAGLRRLRGRGALGAHQNRPTGEGSAQRLAATSDGRHFQPSFQCFLSPDALYSCRTPTPALRGDSYALKAISKGYIVKTGMQESCSDWKL